MPLLFGALLVLLSGCKKDAEPPQPQKPAAVAEKPKPPEKPDRAKSLVTILCGDTTSGPGFFSAQDRVLTRARFTCDAPRVRLHDGRTLLGRVLKAQKDLDVAELEVAGGEGEAIPLSSALEVKETDDLSALPGGALGAVRSIARTRLGVPQLEVAFERVPAPGSVVLDASGQAVGFVTDATLVLPIDAVGPSAKWPEVEARAKPGLAEEVAALRRTLAKPGLVSASIDPSGKLHAVLLSRAKPATVTLDGCDEALTPQWESFRMTQWFDPATRDLFQFIDKHDLDIGLSMSTVVVPCTGTGELSLEGHAVAVGKVAQPMAETEGEAKPPSPEPRQPGVTLANPKGLDATEERIWRGRFSALREEQDLFEKDLREKQRFLRDADNAVRRSPRTAVGIPALTPEERDRYDRYKKDVEEAEAVRAEYKRRSDDLEREASNASVPREWRR